jgi:hypothetical protein
MPVGIDAQPPGVTIAALVIEWDDGLHAMLTTEAIAAELEQATRKSGALIRTSATSTGDGERPYQGRGDLPPGDTAAILCPALIVESVP